MNRANKKRTEWKVPFFFHRQIFKFSPIMANLNLQMTGTTFVLKRLRDHQENDDEKNHVRHPFIKEQFPRQLFIRFRYVLPIMLGQQLLNRLRQRRQHERPHRKRDDEQDEAGRVPKLLP